ncbi:hypothetical protein DICVIV_05863 [Dictyocaulus viviparus]|uniref:C2H2-type domain-containing protein n=1 Tax=Dictyocaulus viviparus TaxID=29172 RepID=A0A0D8XTV7_DICVI|nr:hypothetical protein DICVIV_05863 [Dictyocaulus viviparus]
MRILFHGNCTFQIWLSDHINMALSMFCLFCYYVVIRYKLRSAEQLEFFVLFKKVRNTFVLYRYTMDIPSTSSGIRHEQASAFGFPEHDVIKYINNNGLSEEDARDFMLFLTFANQLRDTSDNDIDVILNATALVNLVTRTNNPVRDDKLLDVFQSEVSNFQRPRNEPLISSSNTVDILPRQISLGSTKTPGKHNDTKFYPNIICVICREWICSRSRRLHIGAHLNYRKYKCSACDFLHTKEIFVTFHIRTFHDGYGYVVEHNDPITEDRIEIICHDSIAMTRDVLSGSYNKEAYADYSNMVTPRNQITNKERSNRTKLLAIVTEATNSQ